MSINVLKYPKMISNVNNVLNLQISESWCLWRLILRLLWRNRVKFIFSCTLKTKRSELNDSNIDHGFCSKSRFKLACQSKLSSSHHSQFSFVSSSIIIFPVYFLLVNFFEELLENCNEQRNNFFG
jgi:hypothetical protein